MNKDEQGRWVLKKSFFIRNLWGLNAFRLIWNFFSKEAEEPLYPEKRGGLIMGTILAPLAWFMAIFFFFPVALIAVLVSCLFGFLSKKIPASVLSLAVITWLLCKNDFAFASAIWSFLKSYIIWILLSFTIFDFLLVALKAVFQSESYCKLRQSAKHPIVFEK